MDVRLSSEQEALRGSAAAIVDRLGPKAVGQIDDAERSAKLEAVVAGTGWRELRVDFEGMPVAGGTEVALVAEELARGLADTAFVGPTLAAELRRLTGAPPTDGPETVLLDPNLSGLAVVGPDGGLCGVAVDASGASSALALASEGDGWRLIAVDIEAAVAPSDPVDLTRTVLISEGGAGHVDVDVEVSHEALSRWTALGLAVTSADLVGVMQGALDLANGYACERQQYGAAIGSFQAVQHLLADALVAAEGSRSSTLHAAWAVDALDADQALAAAAAAKAYSSRAARSVCETAIQVHGGIGNTWECLAHVFLRRALLSTEVFGGVGPNLDRVLAHHGLGG